MVVGFLETGLEGLDSEQQETVCAHRDFGFVARRMMTRFMRSSSSSLTEPPFHLRLRRLMYIHTRSVDQWQITSPANARSLLQPGPLLEINQIGIRVGVQETKKTAKITTNLRVFPS